MNRSRILWGKFLYWLGFPYCRNCGEKKVVFGFHGFDKEPIYVCKECEWKRN